ncbi:LuxR C-terminal-related transcriptional regulator [Pseudonocardia alaniniphila]|uniref:LuxR C-terminal-related transcriptional regulator n=1 Tax=Pseudonocardia alaniniphila TaxID=75291 RepID=UPI0031D28662
MIAVPLVPQAKIAVPPLPSEFVVRPALRSALDAGAAADVSLVCAPAGYGKTLLLADWSRASTDVDTAWVSLDRDDNDPGRLWAAIVAALSACPSIPGGSRLHDPWVWHHDELPECLAELVHAIAALPQPIRLILDDVHELVEPDALHSIEALTRNRTARLQLVLSSRRDPPLSLPRLRLAGRLWELRASQMRFTPAEAATLLEKSGLQLTPAQVEMLHRRTGGWAAGLRLAALGVAESADRDAFLTQFSGDERSVADYLVGEILCALPEDVQEFLRMISISQPVPTRLATTLSGREDAGCLLDRLEHQTSLLSPIGRGRDSYTIQELLRTYLLADLRRQGVNRAEALHAVAARWWAAESEPVRALEHASQSHDSGLLTDMLHRLAIPLILSGDHTPLRDALTCVSAQTVAADPWLALTSAMIRLEAGELPAARGDLRRARQAWPTDGPADLAVLRAVAEQLTAGVADPAQPGSSPAAVGYTGELPAEPELEALARLSRGTFHLECGDRVDARVEFEGALYLSRIHHFDYVTMQSLALLGIVEGGTGDMHSMRAVSIEAAATAAEHGWENSIWAAVATAMLAYTALMRTDTADAERSAAEGLALDVTASSPRLRFALKAIHGAAAFDAGGRASGLAELQQARSEFGGRPAPAELVAALAMLEFRTALLLGHSAAARTVQSWLADRTGETAELLMMQAWAETTGCRHDHVRSLLMPVLEGAATMVLPQTVVEAWLLEASLAVTAGKRSAARAALRRALAVAEPLDALRPFAYAGPNIRELLVHQRGSFGASDAFAERAVVAGASGRGKREPMLSERELTVLGLLPSLLSLDEIATDLAVSVNTVKSHVRSIYTKLGVSSRRLAVLAAHEHGLLSGGVRQA